MVRETQISLSHGMMFEEWVVAVNQALLIIQDWRSKWQH